MTGTIRKSTSTLTLADGGTASEDLNLRSPSGRYYALEGVRVITDETSHRFSVTIYEVDDLEDDDDETYGAIVFHVDQPGSGTYYRPRVVTVDQEGVSTGEENGPVFVSTQQVRVEANGGTNATEVTVQLFVQTAGDQRF